MTTTLEAAPAPQSERIDSIDDQITGHQADELYSKINAVMAGESDAVTPPEWIDTTAVGGELFDLQMKADLTDYEQTFLQYLSNKIDNDGEVLSSEDMQTLLDDPKATAFLAAARQADPALNELVTTDDIQAFEDAKKTLEDSQETDSDDDDAEGEDEADAVPATPVTATTPATPTPIVPLSVTPSTMPPRVTPPTPPQPPQTPPTGPNGGNGNTPPPPTGGGNRNAQPSPAPERRDSLSLEAARARYEATMQDLVMSGARRGSIFINKDEHDEAAIDLHARLDETIGELLALEHPEYLTDTTIDDAQRGALINAFYVGKRAELSKRTSEMMSEGSLSKFNKFVVKHKVAIGLGATVFGGVLGGGIGGAILGKAVASGITKMAKKSEGNREAIGGATLNSGESLRLIDQYIAEQRQAGQPIDQVAIAQLTGINLMEQYEKSVVQARRKGILGSIATGAAWGGLVWAGGHILVDGLDYGWNGSGGVMDHLNHLDNPNGVTPWTPSATKPWWMHGVTPWVIAGGAAGAAFAGKVVSDTKKKPQ